MNNHKWKKSKGTLKTKKHFCSAEEKRRGMRRPMTKPHETEEEATIRRFHDAQRMARFRARKKKALEEAKALQTVDLSKVSVIPELRNKNSILQIGNSVVAVPNTEHFQTQWSVQNPSSFVPRSNKQNKYSQLLEIIERLGKDIKLMYAGSRTSAERLKVGIVRARTLIKECLLETEMYSKQ